MQPLAPDTWRAFADLVEQHNSVFSRCWCASFRSLSRDKDRTYGAIVISSANSSSTGGARALVFNGGGVASRDGHREAPEHPSSAEVRSRPRSAPDYRIACVFVDQRCSTAASLR